MDATTYNTAREAEAALSAPVFITPNVVQQGDALALLHSLQDSCAPLAFFDPQHRAVLDRLKFGNEGERQRGRAKLPAMCESYIDEVCCEIARVLKPSGYLMRWIDTFCLCRIPRQHIKPVDLVAWDNLHPGMGKRSRRRGDYLLVLQKPPIKAGATWRDHGISNRRRWHRERLEEALEGVHADVLNRLLMELKELRSARALVDFIAAQDWAAIDSDTRPIVLHEINRAITEMRERVNRNEPISDALPGEAPCRIPTDPKHRQQVSRTRGEATPGAG
jgi:hypothetical protein